jgi:hypothetical protein
MMTDQQQKTIPLFNNVSSLKTGVIFLNVIIFILNAILFAFAVYVNTMFVSFEGLINRTELVAAAVFAIAGMIAAVTAQYGVSNNRMGFLQFATFMLILCLAAQSGVAGALMGYMGLNTNAGIVEADVVLSCAYDMCCMNGCGVCASNCLNATGYAVCDAAPSVHLPVTMCALVSSDWHATCASSEIFATTIGNIVRKNAPKAAIVATVTGVGEFIAIMLYVTLIRTHRDDE